jgi:ketosteroid isomerase-like protein
MAEGSVREQVGDLVSHAKRRVGVEQPSAADDDGRVGIVRGALHAFGEGDTDAFLDVLGEEDVSWESPGSGHFPGGGEIEGRDEVKKEFVENAGRTYTSFGFRPETFVEADDVDAVIVIGRFEGEGVEGARLDEPGVQVWEFDGNIVSRVRIFTDGAGFPNVVTERKLKEWEEEDKKKEDDDSDDSDDDSGSGEAKASAEKKDDDSEEKSKDEGSKDSGSDGGDDEGKNDQ